MGEWTGDPDALCERLEKVAKHYREMGADATASLFTEAAACIREMVEQRVSLYDAVSLGFYDGFRDAITSDPWEDCYDYAAAKGANYAKSVMARIITKQAADPTRRLNPLPPAPGAEA